MILRLLAPLCVVAMASPAAVALPAFPGAEGTAANVTGGRGGDVYIVTNLNDSGPGSLRNGIQTASGPRTIVFNVSGTIALNSPLNINRSNLTIAGQTAPGGGIALSRHETRISNANNVILQYLHFRPGDPVSLATNTDPDALWVQDSSNVLIDHVTASWGVDETLSVTHGSHNITVQWSMIYESLNHAGHSENDPAGHSFGSLLNGGDMTFHHNLYASNRSRNPRPQQSDEPGQTLRLDFVNNVIYNPGDRYGYSAADRFDMNFVGNYGIDGPNTSTSSNLRLFRPDSPDTRIYAAGNFRDASENGLLDGADQGLNTLFGIPGVDYTPLDAPADLPAVHATDARQAYIQVLSRAGASHYRDESDRRIIRRVLNQAATGDYHIDSQNEVGGWPLLPTAPPPADANGDGIPDAFALAHGHDPSAAIHNLDAGDGYTYLEKYLQSLTPYAYAPAATQPITVSTAFGRGGDAQVNENGGAAATSSGDGSSPTLVGVWAGPAGNQNQAIILRFDLSQVQPGSLTDARLELTAASDITGSRLFRVYGLEHDAAGWDWDEADIAFDGAPGLVFDGDSRTLGIGTADFDEPGVLNLGLLQVNPTDEGGVVAMDNANLAVFLNLAAYFQGSAQEGLVTIILQQVDGSDTPAVFHSREAGASLAPRLVLEATPVPEPAGVALVAAAGLAVTARRRCA